MDPDNTLSPVISNVWNSTNGANSPQGDSNTSNLSLASIVLATATVVTIPFSWPVATLLGASAIGTVAYNKFLQFQNQKECDRFLDLFPNQAISQHNIEYFKNLSEVDKNFFRSEIWQLDDATLKEIVEKIDQSNSSFRPSKREENILATFPTVDEVSYLNAIILTDKVPEFIVVKISLLRKLQRFCFKYSERYYIYALNLHSDFKKTYGDVGLDSLPTLDQLKSAIGYVKLRFPVLLAQRVSDEEYIFAENLVKVVMYGDAKLPLTKTPSNLTFIGGEKLHESYCLDLKQEKDFIHWNLKNNNFGDSLESQIKSAIDLFGFDCIFRPTDLVIANQDSNINCFMTSPEEIKKTFEDLRDHYFSYLLMDPNHLKRELATNASNEHIISSRLSLDTFKQLLLESMQTEDIKDFSKKEFIESMCEGSKFTREQLDALVSFAKDEDQFALEALMHVKAVHLMFVINQASMFRIMQRYDDKPDAQIANISSKINQSCMQKWIVNKWVINENFELSCELTGLMCIPNKKTGDAIPIFRFTQHAVYHPLSTHLKEEKSPVTIVDHTDLRFGIDSLDFIDHIVEYYQP